MASTRARPGVRWTVMFLLLALSSYSQAIDNDYNDGGDDAPPPPRKEQESCDGIFLAYDFISREKLYPHVKNATAQAWAFKSKATVMNAGATELKAWKLWIGFQHKEILVSADGAVALGDSDFPAEVGNGTYLAGYPTADLKTSIDTAGDLDQIRVEIKMKGTQFGVKPPGIPMPKTIRLENDGFKCPAPSIKKSSMLVCCKKDPKFKAKKEKATKYLPRQKADLSMTYDVLQAYTSNYLAQVTMDNLHPLGRLDHWNLTWEWMRGEFIYSMRGAYTHRKEYADCIYGRAGQYYKDLDFSTVMNCEKRPVIADLPADRAKDEKVGNIPYCCRNGSLLPPTMDASKSHSIFQLQVYKTPPDMNRTAFSPPQNWKVTGLLNPEYRCGAPVRIANSEFPDPSGLMSTSYALASWQIPCNITKPETRKPRCCVSFSAYYNDSIIPCNTCACGCEETQTEKCSAKAPSMLLPPEALLVPFDNRTDKSVAWAKMKHYPVPSRMPCPDNCGVSLNWHISSNYKDGWAARVTLFNWDDYSFEDWFTAVQMNKAYEGYENVYSFNGTRVPELSNTLFFQGLPGLNFLVAEANGSDPIHGPRVPGKQQSVISFKKKKTPGINIPKGDGFPTRVFFNGEECSMPTRLPTGSGSRSQVNLPMLIALASVTLAVLLVGKA